MKKRLVSLSLLILFIVIVGVVVYYFDYGMKSEPENVLPPTSDEIRQALDNVRAPTSTLQNMEPEKQKEVLSELRPTTTIVNESALSKLRKK